MPTLRATFGKSPTLAAMLGLALLLKVLVPAGWMPMFADGGVRLGPCGSWAQRTAPAPIRAALPAVDHHARAATHPAGGIHHDMAMPHAEAAPLPEPEPEPAHHDADEHGDHDQPQPHNQPCVFAGAAMAWMLPEAPPATGPPSTRVEADRAIARSLAVGRGLAAPPPPSTGPPLAA